MDKSFEIFFTSEAMQIVYFIIGSAVCPVFIYLIIQFFHKKGDAVNIAEESWLLTIAVVIIIGLVVWYNYNLSIALFATLFGLVFPVAGFLDC